MNRDRTILLAIVTTILTGSVAAADALPIATVNIDRVLKEYKPLLDKLEPLKAQAKELDQNVQVRQAEIETVGTQLRKAQPGSPEQQKLQLQFVKLQQELQQYVNTERQNQQKKQAAVYLAFFRQLDAAISKYAKAHGIRLVIRQQESSLEEGQPLPEVIKALNRGILYEENLDITDTILKDLDAAATSSGVQR